MGPRRQVEFNIAEVSQFAEMADQATDRAAVEPSFNPSEEYTQEAQIGLTPMGGGFDPPGGQIVVRRAAAIA